MLIQTARTLQNDLEKGVVPMPHGFVHNGWSEFLPNTAIVFLNEVIWKAYLGLDCEESIAVIEEFHEKKSRQHNEPLFFEFDNKPTARKKLEIYNEEYPYEIERKKILEQSGYYYPQTVRECIELLEKFNMIHRIKKDGREYFDVVIYPFPHVTSYLKGKEVSNWLKSSVN